LCSSATESKDGRSRAIAVSFRATHMAAVTHSFDDALGYEQFMGRWSRPLGQAFLQWLSLPSDMQWLDIGCGTGIFTRLILGACSPAAVVGIDCAKEPIEHARQSVSSRPWCFDPRPMVTVAICAARTGNRFGLGRSSVRGGRYPRRCAANPCSAGRVAARGLFSSNQVSQSRGAPSHLRNSRTSNSHL